MAKAQVRRQIRLSQSRLSPGLEEIYTILDGTSEIQRVLIARPSHARASGK
jgi:hypothetical protein